MFHYIAGFLATLIAGAYLVNPFSRLSIIRRPFIAQIVGATLETLNENKKIKVRQNIISKTFAYLACGIYVLQARYVSSPKAKRYDSVDDIIRSIHKLRFNPKKLLLTSGDQFSSLYVRNLGVFYYPTLDTSVVTTEEEWHNREICYLQTVAYALGVFDKSDRLTTTIVPTGRYTATGIDLWARPSDTLYGILYAIASLLGIEKARPEDYKKTRQYHDTIPAATMLLTTYKQSLRRHYERYRDEVFDAQSNLIRTSVHLSGAKDITKRTCSFYDNVIFWKTTELAMTLEIIPENKSFLNNLKKNIIDTFWLEDEGYFLEDLSEEGLRRKYYSSDWLIVLATGFLKPARISERAYFSRSIDYIQRQKIDQPFAIKYQNDTRAHRQFPVVRFAVASYGGDSIWSFWGMEYIKSLLLLYKHTGRKAYLDTADYHISQYEKKMLQYRGYPEVYDAKGNMLQTLMYRSIRQTGWVIGFEQVLSMRKTIGG